MQEFVQSVRSRGPVDDALFDAAQELVSGTQSALDRFVGAQARLRAQVEELSRDNAKLRSENSKLKAESQLLREQAASAVTATREPAAAAKPAPAAWKNSSAVGAVGAIGAAAATAEAASDSAGLRFVKSIELHSAPVHAVAMQPSKRIIATASWDSFSNIYDLDREKVVMTLGSDKEVEPESRDAKMGGLYSVAFAKTAEHTHILGCTSCDKNVYVWDTNSGSVHKMLPGHKDEVNGIDFHPKQMVMCTCSDDQKVIIWDYHEGIVLRELSKHEKPVYGCKFLGQEHEYYVSSCGFDRKVRIWDMRDKKVVTTLSPQHSDDIIGIDYSSSAMLLATGSDDGTIMTWDMRVLGAEASGSWKNKFVVDTRTLPEFSGNEVKRVCFSPCGKFLVAAGSCGSALMYDISNHSNVRLAGKLGGHSDCVFDVAWGEHPETGDSLLVSASHDKTLRYWRGRATAPA